MNHEQQFNTTTQKRVLHGHFLYFSNTFYCMNARCQKEHWKVHEPEHRQIRKTMKLLKKKQKMIQKVVKTMRRLPRLKPIQEAEDEEDCPICTDALPKLSHQNTRMTCCGKGLHTKCWADLIENTSMTIKQKNTCILCRKNIPNGHKELIERLHKWVKKGKGWAMAMLAQMYEGGVGVKQSDKKSVELYEMAAKRGNASMIVRNIV